MVDSFALLHRFGNQFIIKLGDFYSFDTVGAISVKLLKKFPENPNLLKVMYSVYTLPNTILPLLGGLLICKFGYRFMFLIFGLLVFLGQFFLAIGCSFNSFPIMVFGYLKFN
jgi:MFS family permease